MIHHQLLPLNQLQIPQLLLPHIRIPPKLDFVELHRSFHGIPADEKCARRVAADGSAGMHLRAVRAWQAGNDDYTIGLTRFDKLVLTDKKVGGGLSGLPLQ